MQTDAHVRRVLFEGKRAVGVEYARGGQTVQARSNREVLLCAGALQSPQLLQLSGIGPAHLLVQTGVPLLHELPGVGENLQDHLALRFVFKCSKPITTNDALKNPWAKLMTGLRYVMFRRGPMAVGVMVGMISTGVMAGATLPDTHYFISTVSAEDRGRQPHKFSGFTIVYYLLRPTSRGTVRIKSADPLAAPAMLFNYLATDHDRAGMLAGALMTRKLAQTRALAPYILHEYIPGPAVASDDEIVAAVRASGNTGYHPVGTCRMGRDAQAVVDPRLRVHGIGGLRVVDASVMPTLVSGNTNAATIMIAEKGADMIRADRGAA